MNPNSDLQDTKSSMADNAQQTTGNAQQHAQSRIAYYTARFAEYSDEEVRQTVEHERKGRGWCSERSYFLAALRAECKKRKIDYCW